MARPESVAVGGFYCTPPHLIAQIARHLAVGEGGGSLHFADPCAGEGPAIFGLFEALGGQGKVFTCELEAQRYAVLCKRTDGYHGAADRALHGDAFNIEMSKGVSLMFLNPPYHPDPVHGRLEQRYLERFTAALREEGVLIFIVPFYALAASAETLALSYDNVQCFRFPKDDYAAFKQVVVFASKVRARLSPDTEILARVQAWSKSVARCPILGSKEDTHTVPGAHDTPTWQLRGFDLKGLVRKARPWRESRSKGAAGVLTAVPHILPEIPVADLLFRTFMVATAPRPAHIAAGIASGLFNGREVTPKTKGMPNLLVKGVFTREFHTVQENVNSKGEISSVVQVQQPKLETTVLDLRTKQYSLLKPVGAPKTDVISEMSIEGLLEHYGPSLMDVMAQQCPVIYDPKRDADDMPLAPVGRPLFRAHVHAAKALLKVLGGPGLSRAQRQQQAAILLGEIGSGKTATVLALANTMAKRTLVVCPPHLLDSWENETHTVLPDAEVRILDDISDVDALCDIPADRTVIAVISREDAKLGHGVAAVSYLGCCPKCGAPLPSGDLAKKRARCEAQPLTLGDDLARAAFSLAFHLAPQAPTDGNIRGLLEGRHLGRYLTQLVDAPKKKRAKWAGFDADWVLMTIDAVSRRLQARYSQSLANLLGELLMAVYTPELIADVARSFAGSNSYDRQGLARALTCLLPPGSDLQREVQAVTYATNGAYAYYSFSSDETALKDKGLHQTAVGSLKVERGQILIDEAKPGSLELAKSILTKLIGVAALSRAEDKCGEPLFQAVPEPRRYPVAKYIARRHPDLFDFLLLDEGHEYQNGDTAQSHAAHRLTALGLPFVLVTGSLMNGYAESLFTNMWAVSPDFRAEFRRDEKQKHNERYGYNKRILTDKDRETKEIVAFGTQTDRVERATRTAGKAPGVLPLFLFRHLLKYSVTLHKADLALDLPKCHHITHEIEPSPKLLESYKAVVSGLMARIQKDRFSTDGRAGKLFGALAELPSYLDLAAADVGNQDDGSYGVYYPKSIGGDLVVKADSFPAKTILPKEQWMIDTVRAELKEGRNVMVFASHVKLTPRLGRLLRDALGIEVAVLDANKVPTKKREAWINANVRAKGVRVMVTNPIVIQTGLNNLVHFNSEVWMENPMANPTIFRQAVGRVDRVGAKKETRIHFPVYKGTLQVQLHELLLRKVAVATACDGLDSESMLLAAGAGDDAMLTGLSIGRQLWEMMVSIN